MTLQLSGIIAKSIEAHEAKLNRTVHCNSCANDMTVALPFWTENSVE